MYTPEDGNTWGFFYFRSQNLACRRMAPRGFGWLGKPYPRAWLDGWQMSRASLFPVQVISEPVDNSSAQIHVYRLLQCR